MELQPNREDFWTKSKPKQTGSFAAAQEVQNPQTDSQNLEANEQFGRLVVTENMRKHEEEDKIKEDPNNDEPFTFKNSFDSKVVKGQLSMADDFQMPSRKKSQNDLLTQLSMPKLKTTPM